MKKENAYIMKRKTPFKNLESLDGKIEKVADFVLTEKMENEIEKTLRRYEKLIEIRDEKLRKEEGGEKVSETSTYK